MSYNFAVYLGLKYLKKKNLLKVTKKIIWIHLQTTKISSALDESEITFHLKLINIPLNVLQYKFLTSGIVPVGLFQFAVLPDVFILLHPHEQEEHVSSWGRHLAVNSAK